MKKIASSNLFKKPLLEMLESRWVPTVRVISSFEGMNNTGYYPPDTNLAVGPKYAIEVVNSSIAIYDKSNGKEILNQTFDKFLPSSFYTTGLFDPIVMYDDIDQRFVAVTHEYDEGNKKSFIDFAVSKSSDPTQGFVEFIQVDTSEFGKNWVDNGKIGFNGTTYIFSGNVYSINSSDPPPNKSIVIAVDKSSVLDNNPATSTYYSTYRSGIFSFIPARMHGASKTDPMWFSETNFAGGSTIQVTKMENILSNSPNYTDTSIAVTTYTPPPGSPQKGSNDLIDSSDCRTQTVEWNNGRMVSGFETTVKGDPAAAWVIFSTDNTAKPTLLEEGQIHPGAGIATSYPGPTLDSFGNLALTYTQSSANEYLSMYVSGKSPTEPKGVLQTPVLVIAGTAPLTGLDNGLDRAGDYAGISPDPIDGTFWAANEYGSAGVAGNWRTKIANFSISKAQVITFDPLNPVVYGVAPITLNATGGLSGNPVTYSIISGPGVIQGNKLKVSGAGTIVIEANQAGNQDYLAAAPVRQSLIVLQAPLTVQANDFQRPYASANPAFTFSYTGFVNSDDASTLSNLGATTTALITSPIGTYPITPTASNPNYTITLVPGKLKVIPASLTIIADNKSKAYGGPVPTLTTTIQGLASFETPAVIAGLGATTTATASSPVGNFDIVPIGTNTNYSITYVKGILSVAKADLVLSADNKSKIYGDPLPNLTSSLSGLVNGDSASLVTGISLSTTALVSSSVGDFPISVTGTLSSQNYNLVLVSGKLSVTKAVLTLKADDKSRLYGTDNPIFTVQVKGLVNGDAPTILTDTGATTTALTSSSVGAYPIAPFGTLNSPNYKLSLENGTLSINTATLTITAEEKTKVYGAPLPPLTVIVKGLVNGDKESSLTGLGADTTGNAASPVGTYTITPRGSNPNYTIQYVTANFVITKAQLTIQADDKSRIYGAKDPVFTNSFIGLVNGDTPGSISGISDTTSATDKSSVGNYLIIPNGSTLNYQITFVTGKLQVTPAALTITADNKTKAYGAPNPALTSTYSGILSFDNPTQVISGLTGTFPVPVNEKTAVGTYAIEPTATLLSPNYFIDKKVNGQIIVTPAILSIKGDNQSKVYGAPMPTLTYTVTGLVNNDPISIISGLGVQTKAQAFSVVGTYPILASGTTTNPNYTIELVAGVFEITKASLVISAANKSKIYGAPMPELTTELTGLVNFDSAAAITGLGASTKAKFWSPAGSYDIVPTGTNPNYEITYVNGSLAINKAQLTIAAKNSSKTYGAPVPDLTPVITGLVNGDTPKTIGDLAVSTLVTSGSPVGTYPVKVTGSNANYEVTRIDGTVIVTPALLTITTETVSKVYGDPLPKIKTIVSGLVNGDTESQIKDLGATTLALASSKVGTYKTVPTGSINNYLVNLVEGTLKVTKAPLSIVANDLSYTKGIGSLPALTYRLDNLVNGDGSDAIKGTPVLTTTATTRSDFGTYPVNINAGQVLSDNYELTAKAGTLTINPVSNPVIPVGNRPAIVTVGGNAGFAIYDAGKKLGTINPFPGFTGSIKTAVADIDGDAVMDIVAAAGAGGPSQIKIYTGRSLELIKTLTPFAPTFKGGVNVKVADVDGDGNLDIVAVPASGAAPVVKLLKADGTPIGSFLAFAQNFTKGVNLEVGDLNQDGTSEIIAWPNAGGGPNVKVFNAIGVAQTSFFAYEANYTGGLSLAIGDVTGDGNLEIITGRGNSIRVFDTRGSRLSEWNPYGTTLFPVQVAVANLDGTTQSTIVTALGGTGSAVVKNYTGQGSQIGTATVFPGNFRSGLSLAVVSTNGGKKQELVAAPGAGASPELKRYGTSKLALIDSVFAADPKFRGGLGLS